MAAVLSGLAGVPPFEFNTTVISGLATKWLSWKASFDIFAVASGGTNDTQMRALLLHMVGECDAVADDPDDDERSNDKCIYDE